MNDVSNQRPLFLHASISLSVIIAHLAAFYILMHLTPPQKPINQSKVNVSRIEIELLKNSIQLKGQEPNSKNQSADMQDRPTHNSLTQDDFIDSQAEVPDLFPFNDISPINNNAVDTLRAENDYQDFSLSTTLDTTVSSYNYDEFTDSLDDSVNQSNQRFQPNYPDFTNQNDNIVNLPVKNPLSTSQELVPNNLVNTDTTTPSNTLPTHTTRHPADASENNPAIKPPLPSSSNTPEQTLSETDNKITNPSFPNQINPSDSTNNQTPTNESKLPSDYSQNTTTKQTQILTNNNTASNNKGTPESKHHKGSSDFGHAIMKQQNTQTVERLSGVERPVMLPSLPIYISRQETLKNLIEPLRTSLPPSLKEPASQKEKWELIVVLYVDKQGNIMRQPEPIVKQSSGNILIDEDALSIAKQARFRPFIRNGKPQIAEVRLPLTYQR